jgi:hypothetical protein
MQLKVHFRGTEMWVNEVCHLNGKTLSREDYQLFAEEERKRIFFVFTRAIEFLISLPKIFARGNTRYIYVFLTNWRVAVMAANI